MRRVNPSEGKAAGASRQVSHLLISEGSSIRRGFGDFLRFVEELLVRGYRGEALSDESPPVVDPDLLAQMHCTPLLSPFVLVEHELEDG